MILQFESYQENYDEYNKILNFINNDELIKIYEKADELQTKYICNDKMESEFSDYVLNLLWDLRVIYKKYLEGVE